jgi:hypothetical protein
MDDTTKEIKLRLSNKLNGMSKKEAVTFLSETEPQLSNISIAAVLNCNATYVSQLKSKLRGTSKQADKSQATKSKTRKPEEKKPNSVKAVKSMANAAKATRRKARTTVFAKKAVQTGSSSDGNIFDIRRTLQAMANTYSIEQLKIAIQDIENHG